MARLRLITCLVGATIAAVPTAAAHIEIKWPIPRHGYDDQKDSPCGLENSVPIKVYRYEPGRTITLQWNEVLDHDAHYRIAFDPSGDDSFIDPEDENDLYNDPDIVLADGIEDKNGGLYVYDVTLPDVPCENCTLQLIQVMKDDFGGTFSGNYFACVDFAMQGDSLDEPPPGDGDSGGSESTGDGSSDGQSDGGGGAGDDTTDGAGCGCRSEPTPSLLGLLAFGLLGLRPRRRPVS